MAVLLVLLIALGMSAPATAVPLPPDFQTVRTDCPYYQDGGSCWDVTTRTVFLEPYAGRHVLWHELGHAFDDEVLTNSDRAAFMRVMRLRGPWVQGTGYEKGADRSPNEWFADAYADCQLGREPRRNRKLGVSVGSTSNIYGYAPTRGQRRQVCSLVR